MTTTCLQTLKAAAINWRRRHPQPVHPARPPRVQLDLSRAFTPKQAERAGLLIVSEGYVLPAHQTMLEQAAGQLEAGGIQWALVKQKDGIALARV